MITEDQQPTSLQLYGLHLFMHLFKKDAHICAAIYMQIKFGTQLGTQQLDQGCTN